MEISFTRSQVLQPDPHGSGCNIRKVALDISYLSFSELLNAAWAAARRATGTRKGEQLT